MIFDDALHVRSYDRLISCPTFLKKFISVFKKGIQSDPKCDSIPGRRNGTMLVTFLRPFLTRNRRTRKTTTKKTLMLCLFLTSSEMWCIHRKQVTRMRSFVIVWVSQPLANSSRIQRAWFLSWNPLAVDDSGRWGRGGVFDAISERSPLPGEHYRLAHRMGDLAVGDVHLVRCDDRTARNAGGRDFVSTAPFSKTWLVSSVLFPTSLSQVALLVAHKRDKNGYLLPLSLSILERCFKKVRQAAQRMKGTTVCLPLLIYHILSVWMNESLKQNVACISDQQRLLYKLPQDRRENQLNVYNKLVTH